MPGGRPLKFKSVENLQSMIDDYFAETNPEEVTITGLALFLDTSRETLMNYEKRDEYFDAIKRAKDKVQLEYEKDLRKKGRSGDIFALKNFGWTDQQHLDVSTKGDKLGAIQITPEAAVIINEYEKKLRQELTK